MADLLRGRRISLELDKLPDELKRRLSSAVGAAVDVAVFVWTDEEIRFACSGPAAGAREALSELLAGDVA